MLHEPVAQLEKDNAIAYKTTTGIWMFVLYGLVYLGFIVINIVNPVLMETIVFAGLNLAVVYGIGLIVFALILAVIYNALCVKKEQELNTGVE
jgi:uncharacterized membrane protein (DUF485 family)